MVVGGAIICVLMLWKQRVVECVCRGVEVGGSLRV